MQVLALIPARMGSKSVPNKNIRLIDGKPLMAYSVEHALCAKSVTRVIVSTDSSKYATIAKKYGAETPFLRPRELATDISTDLEVFQHALRWLADNEGYHADICVHLRVTYPARDPRDIDAMVNLLKRHAKADAVRSIVLSAETPFKMWFLRDDGMISPVVQSRIKDAYNIPRQQLPKTFVQNACIDVVRTSVIIKKQSMTGSRILGYVMNHFYDIDSEDQLKLVRKILRNEQHYGQKQKKNILFRH